MVEEAISVVIPTYNREHVLLETIGALMSVIDRRTLDLIIVDQSKTHTSTVSKALSDWEKARVLRLIKLSKPSVPAAMNRGLISARNEIILFLDDDIRPEPGLIDAHLAAHKQTGVALVAGRVIQPWQEGADRAQFKSFDFASTQPSWCSDFMGGNFSINRTVAMALGGFDENFVAVAYRFESEFAFRLRQAGHKIFFEPKACVHHLKVPSGGTRTYGQHLRTLQPYHSVGAYYFTLRTWNGWRSMVSLVRQPFRAIATRHHLKHPWWIPLTLVAEIRGFIWALRLFLRGPKYISESATLLA